MEIKKAIKTFVLGASILSLSTGSSFAQSSNQLKLKNQMETNQIHYRNVKADGLNVFYREAGPKNGPVVLLLHGFPTSSFMYRNLIPILSTKYHVIAPDMPGFGFTDAPGTNDYQYTFENLTKTMQAFINELRLKRFAVYIFDYGAPVGLRLALANPEKITGIISQNGNAYEEGMSRGWNGLKEYWKSRTPEMKEKIIKPAMSFKTTKWQYETGVSDLSLLEPETYTLDQYFLDRPGMADKQMDLMADYESNIKLYPAFHAYFREYKPMLLAVWGNKDPYFIPPGAEAFKKDLPNAKVKLYDTGHFALETHLKEISTEILEFLEKLPK
ncbi:alpha/beta fold hydrolase [Chryseobacterium paridis]|uniref:Alpha/beta fold hydrolase n=1 Tax=Chryseobacterium paridis TaxID=2800328 RepID=A0ABS1FY32_9FLAO|nr:alpha/beta fold hydrolase [Chryseobacterium paridis]MBK1897366.1 alpha/beta fold hydrolase [Chryseobacterium paridis]